jgi:hypothetical protein
VADDIQDEDSVARDESETDDPSGDQQPDGGVDPVTASPQEYPGKPGA